MTDRAKPERPPDTGGTVLEGVVGRIVFRSDTGRFAVLHLELEGRAEPIKVVGELATASEGEHLRLRGRFERDPKWGEQFRADSYVPIRPSTRVGLERFLGSGLVKGIGKVVAERIVARFGLDALDVLDHDPDRLREVEGIGPKRAAMIRESWRARKGLRDVAIFLQSHGVSSAYALRIFKTYGDRAVAFVEENPYRLAVDVPGIGFLSADRIAGSLGIERDSPRRLEAGVLHVLSEASRAGHVYLPRDRLTHDAERILGAPGGRIDEAVRSLASAGRVAVEERAGRVAIYDQAMHRAESEAAARLVRLARTPARRSRIDVAGAIARVERESRLRLGREQRTALRLAIENKVVVLTGGPGTGKTTLVNSILRVLRREFEQVELCAPTGRAARRMSEATGSPARTIHRLLEYSPEERRFTRDAENSLHAELVIVDEMSMVDLPLFWSLVRALPKECRLVLVGDVDQLPSVGPGRVLAEVIESERVPVARLRYIYRQAAESLIVTNAHRVNRGELPVLAPPSGLSDFYFHACDDPDESLRVVLRLVSERIPDRFGLRPFEDIQVLSPMHKGTLGTVRLNAELQALLNPGGQGLERGERRFLTGDKVMQIQNDYGKDVYNGDIGRIVSVDREEGSLAVSFANRVVAYKPTDLDSLVPAYACTIHKSQGSEFPAVVLPVHDQHFVMLRRNLIYTAITRGKKLVVIVGSSRAMALAVRNDRDQARFSALGDRLRAARDVAREPGSARPPDPPRV